jgi:putative DNA primase/helicase
VHFKNSGAGEVDMAGNKTPIPYKEIASAALNSIESLVKAWLPGGKRVGMEWQVTNPNRADANPGSFNVNIRGDSLHIGRWGDFATDDAKGKDLIGLYAYLNYLDQWDAAIEVADLIGFQLPDGCRPQSNQGKERKAPIVDHTKVKPKKVKVARAMTLVVPVPSGAPEAPLANPYRGLPVLKWEYKDANGQTLGYIFRFNKSNGEKEHTPLTLWRDDATGKLSWEWKQWSDKGRPLYGLDRLAAKPEAWVLLVEGEKCADAPGDMIQGATVTWPGGANAWKNVDWSPLAGKKIRAWSDCDGKREKLTNAEKEDGIDPLSKPLLPEHKQPGVKAMLGIKAILEELDPTTDFELIDIPKPLEKPDGWDIADAITVDKFTPDRLRDFLTHTREFSPADAVDTAPDNVLPFKPKLVQPPDPAAASDEDEPATWKSFLLRTKGYDLVPNLSNVWDILQNDDRWQGVLAYDEFAQRVVKLKKPPFWNGQGEVGEWNAQDDAHTAVWLAKIYRFSPSAGLVAEAVELHARSNTVNPPKDWITSLKWDGQERLPTWMQKYMGVPITKYTKRVATWFFMGMVKRVLEPGCKFDYCLVLEGPQGRKKSSALAVIGGEWYGDTDLDLHNKDSMSALRGKILYEFSELGSVAKAEATKQKSFLSRQVDEYRPVYGRREIRVPRQLVFSGSTNEWEWNKDPTGGRRFWPVEVMQEIDIDGLKAVRDQLFAEALERVNDGLRYWPTLEEQTEYFDKEQLKRTIHESYIDAIEPFLNIQVTPFTLYHVANEWLKIDPSKISRDIQTRLGNALRQLDCKRVEKRNSEHRFWYEPPPKKQALSGTGSNQNDEDDDDQIPF